MQLKRTLDTKSKSEPINLKNTFPEKNQYSLKQNFFDPAKSSPPNIFMIKLYARMVQYDSNYKNDVIFDNK